VAALVAAWSTAIVVLLLFVLTGDRDGPPASVRGVHAHGAAPCRIPARYGQSAIVNGPPVDCSRSTKLATDATTGANRQLKVWIGIGDVF
jgi:hypothetical protein